MQDDENKQKRDEMRADFALQTVKDVLWRFNESNEGTLSVYDLLGYLLEDLVKEGFCPACVTEVIDEAWHRAGVNPNEHRAEEEIPPERDPSEAVH